MQPSKYQQAIYDEIADGSGNLIIEAVAGSGKTTTIVEALKLTSGNVLFLAFNKHIADELQSRVPVHVEAKTLHSLGYSICRANYPKIYVDKNKLFKILKKYYKPSEMKECYKHSRPIQQLIRLLKTDSGPDLSIFAKEICEQHGIELSPKLTALAAKIFSESIQDVSSIDFDDMIYYPVVNIESFDLQYDYVFVDEAQDLSKIQMDFILKLNAKRVVAVGDSSQAIYGFRGAGFSSMDDLKNRLHAKELPLSMCYRCSKSVVRKAQSIVPHIEHTETADEGAVHYKAGDIKQGDFVLCRCTAPLVSLCLRLIRSGKQAFIRGKDIGEMLKSFVYDFETEDTKILEEKIRKLLKEKDNPEITDRCNTVLTLLNDGLTVPGLIKTIEEVFRESGDGIMLSTIHKSKGLEADRVHIIESRLLPHPKCKLDWQKVQEKNLEYVAITRARKELFIC